MGILKPLLLREEMPNLAKIIEHGVAGKLRTIAAPVCPRVYSGDLYQHADDLRLEC